MSRSASRRWIAFCLIGIAIWVGVTVVAAIAGADPSDGRPVVLAFAGGAAAFFGAVFGVALWQTRARPEPELDALLAELALEPDAGSGGIAAISGMRRTARVYIVLGALVTALGLAAIVQEGLGFGSSRATLYVTVGIVVCWALAVPAVLRSASAATTRVLAPLGLSQRGASITGERHGRRVEVLITSRGSVTRLDGAGGGPELAGAAILAYAGRGDAAIWEGVRVEGAEGEIVVRREGHERAAWLWDLWLAERLAADAGG